MRIAIISLLAFLVARPVIHSLGLARWLGGSSRTSRIVVLDDSLSMGLNTNGQTSFDRAVDLATQLAREVEPQDRFTLVLASRPKNPLLHEIEVLDADAIVQLLKQQKPSAAFVSWAPTMAAVDELVSIHHLSHARSDAAHRPASRRLGAKPEGNCRPLGRRKCALANFQSRQRCQPATDARGFEAARYPAHWPGPRPAGKRLFTTRRAPISITSKPRCWSTANPIRCCCPTLPAGQRVNVPLTATFQEPGLHHLSLRLPGDELPALNQRWNVVDVRQQLRVALVDGQPSSEPLAGETDFLALALSLGGDDSQAFQVEIITDADIDSLAHDPPDLVVLANVASLTPAAGAALAPLGGIGHGA